MTYLLNAISALKRLNVSVYPILEDAKQDKMHKYGTDRHTMCNHEADARLQT